MILEIDSQLQIRSFDETMAQELFHVVDRNREHLQQWLTWVPFQKSSDDTRAFLQLRKNEIERTGGFGGGIFWENKIVGTVGFHSFQRVDNSASIGYWLSKDMTGKGIVTRSVQRLLQHGFEDLLLYRIELRASTENEKSWRIAERVGFTREGCIRKCSFVNGRYLDHYVYGILQNEFDKSVQDIRI